MAEILQLRTSTLVVKLPSEVSLPAFNEKPRTRKAILRTIIQTLQTQKMELLYVGPQQESFNDYNVTSEGIIVAINVLNGTSDYNLSQDVLLKRFKKELQYNNEHILIDSTNFNNGVYQRNIEIYIKSRTSDKPTVPGYTFATSAGFYSDYQRSF